MKILSELKKLKAVTYNTRPIRIVAALLAAQLLVTFDHPYSIIVLLGLPAYYYALISNTVLAFILVEWIHQVTARLDIFRPWPFFPFKRLAAQILLGFVVPALTAVLMAAGYYDHYGYRLAETKFFSQYFYLIILLLALVNAYYLLHFAFKVILMMLDLNEKERVVRKMDLTGDEKNKWPTQDIALIQTELTGCFAYTTSGEKIIWNTSLEKTIDNLPYESYFMVNRSAIVYVGNILKVANSTSRRFSLTLKSPAGMEVEVSQGRVKGFKNWMEVNGIEVV